MANILSILIIEDELRICENFKRIADTNPNIKIVETTNSSKKGYEYTKKYLPDVVILDLEFYNGFGTGLDYLYNMRKDACFPKPYILITTNNSSPLTLGFARNYGADFIMSKRQSGYSEETVINFLIMLADTIKASRNSYEYHEADNSYKNSNVSETAAQYNSQLKRNISYELNNIGINPKVIGYNYLIDAIILKIKNPDNNIYNFIGKKFQKTPASVERAMQNAINNAWKLSEASALAEKYTAKIHSERGVPTITEFIHYYANKITFKE